MIPNAVWRWGVLVFVLLASWAPWASAQSSRSHDDLSGLARMLRDLGRDDSVKGPLVSLLGVPVKSDSFPVRLIAVTLSKQPQRIKLLFIPRSQSPDGDGDVMMASLDGAVGTSYRATAGGVLEAAISAPLEGEPRRLPNEQAMEGFRREVRWWLDRERILRDALRQPSREPGELCLGSDNRFRPCD